MRGPYQLSGLGVLDLEPRHACCRDLGYCYEFRARQSLASCAMAPRVGMEGCCNVLFGPRVVVVLEGFITMCISVRWFREAFVGRLAAR